VLRVQPLSRLALALLSTPPAPLPAAPVPSATGETVSSPTPLDVVNVLLRRVLILLGARVGGPVALVRWLVALFDGTYAVAPEPSDGRLIISLSLPPSPTLHLFLRHAYITSETNSPRIHRARFLAWSQYSVVRMAGSEPEPGGHVAGVGEKLYVKHIK